MVWHRHVAILYKDETDRSVELEGRLPEIVEELLCHGHSERPWGPALEIGVDDEVSPLVELGESVSRHFSPLKNACRRCERFDVGAPSRRPLSSYIRRPAC